MSRIVADKFYTRGEVVVESCISFLGQHQIGLGEWDNIIEPAAGNGEWLDYLPGVQAFDILPEDERIRQLNYLEWDYSSCLNQKNLVIGNPPFGKNSSLAVQFFNYSARYATTIALIVPRTFRKASVLRRLDKNFGVVGEMLLPPYSFYCGEQRYNVPCVFKIWSRGLAPEVREEVPVEIGDWSWCRWHENPQWAIRRVGSLAGQVRPYRGQSPASHYFGRGCVDLDWGRFYDKFWRAADSCKWDVAGNPSIVKGEWERALAVYLGRDCDEV